GRISPPDRQRPFRLWMERSHAPVRAARPGEGCSVPPRLRVNHTLVEADRGRSPRQSVEEAVPGSRIPAFPHSHIPPLPLGNVSFTHIHVPRPVASADPFLAVADPTRRAIL